MASNAFKVDRVEAPQNSRLQVDLYIDREKGIFFAKVGMNRIESDTKADAIVKVRAALSKVSSTEWREVILFRVEKRSKLRDEEEAHGARGWENGIPIYESGCHFSYMRCERATNPLNRKETLERDHREDFEERVAEERAQMGGWNKKEKKDIADAVEARMREERATCAGAHHPWRHQDRHEFELPYSPEAWKGIQRIAEALRETQARLDAFVKEATPEKLVALALGGWGGEVLKALPPAAKEKR